MNKKLLATAVAGTFIAPAAMAQDPELTVYARINNAFEVTSPATTPPVARDWSPQIGDAQANNYTDVRNVSSRFGIKGSTDMGNGMSVHGRYEFSTFTDREGQRGGRGGINDTRLGYVGISGGFGTIDMGNQWSGFYNTVGTHIDPTYSLGGYIYSSFGGQPYRESNAIKYSNDWGGVHLELDTRWSNDPTLTNGDTEKLGSDNPSATRAASGQGGESGLDGWGLALSWSNDGGNISIAGAVDQELWKEDDDVDRYGLAARFGFADAHAVSVGWAQLKTDDELFGGTPQDASADRQIWSIYYHGQFGVNRVMAGYVGGDNKISDNGQTPGQVLLGFYRNLGGGFRVYYEGTFLDADVNTDADFGDEFDFDDSLSQHLFGMRYDF